MLEKSIPTKESDCYALGMVIYEVLSGRTPFSRSKAPVVMRKVLDGERPERPEESPFTDVIWGLLQLCWKPQPCDRIDARAILLGLGGDPPPLDKGMDTGTDTDYQIFGGEAGQPIIAGYNQMVEQLPDLINDADEMDPNEDTAPGTCLRTLTTCQGID